MDGRRIKDGEALRPSSFVERRHAGYVHTSMIPSLAVIAFISLPIHASVSCRQIQMVQSELICSEFAHNQSHNAAN